MTLIVGDEPDKSDKYVIGFAAVFVGMIVITIARSPSTFGTLVGLAVLGPFAVYCISLLIPDSYFDVRYVFDKKARRVTRSTRHLFKNKKKHRFTSEFDAFLVIEDRHRYGTLGEGPRLAVFLKLRQPSSRVRAVFLDYLVMPSEKNRAKLLQVLETIGSFAGYETEMLCIDGKMEDNFLDDENW